MTSASAEPRATVLRTFVRPPADPRIGWLPYAWLFYLATLFVGPVLDRAPAGVWLITVAATIAFVALYFRSYWTDGRELVMIAAATVALGIGLSPTNVGASVLFVYAAAMVARVGTLRQAAVLLTAITAIAGLTALWIDAPGYYWFSALLLTPFIGAINYQSEEVAKRDRRLERAQAEVERLAAIAERERIARDLHDVLGHTLTLIVRKAELASRLADTDPAAALREIRELEQVSRSALSDVRDAVSGYRTHWEREVARAAQMLESSGIELSIVGTPPALGRAEDAVALGLREAVTNVARHAEATRCEVRWERDGARAVLLIADDGNGREAADGNGLRGIRERAEAIGGSAERLPGRDGRGSVVRITVPMERA